MNSEREIKTAVDFQDLFHTMLNTPLTEMKENVVGEYAKIFRVSDWVHIAFIRFDDKIDSIRIEVEVSLPTSVCGDSLGDSSDQMQILQGMMTHIMYIRNLLEIGFTLSVIKEDCLWVASYLTSEKPSQEIFEAMVPHIVK
jgi:hypothetical protein